MPDPDPADALEHTYAVAELSGLLNRLLSQAFPGPVWVRGQIRNLARARSGHVYLDLAEPGPLGAAPSALLPVVLLSSEKAIVNAALRGAGVSGIRFDDGIEVRIAGRIGWFGPGGRLQLRMTAIDPTYTLGRLAEDRDRLIATLRAEDLIDRNSTRRLPALPARVAVVTSLGSAAHADFVHELERHAIALRLLEVDARMQGLDAAVAVPAAIAAAVAAGADLVAVVRGGGARTDLAPFDSEAIARAIATAPVPVLTGIGHEVDRSVADEVAHTSFKTPTACAAFVANLVLDAVEAIDDRWDAVARLSAAGLDRATDRLRDRGTRVPRAVGAALAGAERATAEASSRLGRESVRALDRATARLDLAATRARALDPALALARGWSITRNADGQVVRAADAVRPGDVLVTSLGRGTVRSTVDATDADA